MRKFMSIFCASVTLLGAACINANAALSSKATKPSNGKHQQKSVGLDPFAWLGPLPTSLDRSSVEKARHDLLRKIESDLHGANPDVLTFTCRTPAQMGSTPLMERLERYLDAYPESESNQAQLTDLHAAAAAGNWLARGWLFSNLINKQDIVSQYRALQLGEWMRDRNLGPVFRWFSKTTGDDAEYTTQNTADIHAAMRQSYPAQYELGKQLAHDEDLAKAAVGQHMMACAEHALPSYPRLLGIRTYTSRRAMWADQVDAPVDPTPPAGPINGK
ncbi:hypothetical protein LK542_13125 [Massilia sp. IC2-477]|uniref:hypothetical protein n=1 Tax=Massilia sp. IC2-477 TaxID=2887198 RepID=UPI001D12C854|nr:hypothetical protein [Massilia sp. IC2-477]MCC2956555.1 hypothetical protein [Massilia sp. IC2-477]